MRFSTECCILIALVCIPSASMAQVAPPPDPCRPVPQVSLGVVPLTPAVPTPQQIESAKGPQLIAAPSPATSPDPCAGFSPGQPATSDGQTIQGVAQDLTKNGLQNVVLNAADLPRELPTDPLADLISQASTASSLLLPEGSLKDVLATTLPELLASTWVTAGFGVSLQSSSTESEAQNQTGPTALVYHSALDAERQLQSLTNLSESTLDLSQLRAVCARLSSSVSAGASSLTAGQLSQANQVIALCQQTLSSIDNSTTTPQAQSSAHPQYQPPRPANPTGKTTTPPGDCPLGAKVCH